MLEVSNHTLIWVPVYNKNGLVQFGSILTSYGLPYDFANEKSMIFITLTFIGFRMVHANSKSDRRFWRGIWQWTERLHMDGADVGRHLNLRSWPFASDEARWGSYKGKLGSPWQNPHAGSCAQKSYSELSSLIISQGTETGALAGFHVISQSIFLYNKQNYFYNNLLRGFFTIFGKEATGVIPCARSNWPAICMSKKWWKKMGWTKKASAFSFRQCNRQRGIALFRIVCPINNVGSRS